MKYPNFAEEKKLWKQGYKIVAGLDEAGRGPLAGPVVAAAVVIINPKHEIRWTPAGGPRVTLYPKQIQKIKNQNSKRVFDFGIRISSLNIRDSKQLSEKQREKIYKKIIDYCDVVWGVGIVSEKVIDKINILEATKLAMKRAVMSLRGPRLGGGRSNLESVHKASGLPRSPCLAGRQAAGSLAMTRGFPDFLLIDGNFKLDLNESAFARGFSAPKQKSIIKGDQKVFSISAASIIAKVTRDRLMKKYHKKYPQYGFDKHKGYGTKAHFANLEKFGLCKIHRKTFCA